MPDLPRTRKPVRNACTKCVLETLRRCQRVPASSSHEQCACVMGPYLEALRHSRAVEQPVGELARVHSVPNDMQLRASATSDIVCQRMRRPTRSSTMAG